MSPTDTNPYRRRLAQAGQPAAHAPDDADLEWAVAALRKMGTAGALPDARTRAVAVRVSGTNPFRRSAHGIPAAAEHERDAASAARPVPPASRATLRATRATSKREGAASVIAAREQPIPQPSPAASPSAHRPEPQAPARRDGGAMPKSAPRGASGSSHELELVDPSRLLPRTT